MAHNDPCSPIRDIRRLPSRLTGPQVPSPWGWHRVCRVSAVVVMHTLTLVHPQDANTVSPKERRIHIPSLTLLILLMLSLPGWSKDVPLFVIQRSKNANEVQYYLRVGDHCRIISNNPVRAVWKLREESREATEPLSAVEQLAYGVKRQHVRENGVEFRLRALEEKPLTATATYYPGTGTCVPSVQVEIQDQWVALTRISVQTDEGGFRPKVRYIDLVGRRVAGSPSQVTERITP
jgi:hypothetical protein